MRLWLSASRQNVTVGALPFRPAAIRRFSIAVASPYSSTGAILVVFSMFSQGTREPGGDTTHLRGDAKRPTIGAMTKTRGRPPGVPRPKKQIRLHDSEAVALVDVARQVGMGYTTWLRRLGMAVAAGDYPPAVASWLRRIELAPAKRSA